MTKKKLVTGGMTIQEVIELYPDTMEVFADWGLGCATCHIGAIETLEDGALAHGFAPEEVEDLIDELDTVANDMKASETND